MRTSIGLLLATTLSWPGSARGGPPIDIRDPDPGSRTIVIPPEIITSTGTVDRLRQTGGGKLTADAEKAMEGVTRHLNGIGPSNVFLVPAADLSGAVVRTELLLSRGATLPDELPLSAKPADRPDVWVVAYLGTDSGTPGWILRRVERTGQRIRVVYRKGGGEAGLVQIHMNWVPLGQLPDGKYALELYDEVAKEASLTRIVRVRSSPRGLSK